MLVKQKDVTSSKVLSLMMADVSASSSRCMKRKHKSCFNDMLADGSAWLKKKRLNNDQATVVKNTGSALTQRSSSATLILSLKDAKVEAKMSVIEDVTLTDVNTSLPPPATTVGGGVDDATCMLDLFQNTVMKIMSGQDGMTEDEQCSQVIQLMSMVENNNDFDVDEFQSLSAGEKVECGGGSNSSAGKIIEKVVEVLPPETHEALDKNSPTAAETTAAGVTFKNKNKRKHHRSSTTGSAADKKTPIKRKKTNKLEKLAPDCKGIAERPATSVGASEVTSKQGHLPSGVKSKAGKSGGVKTKKSLKNTMRKKLKLSGNLFGKESSKIKSEALPTKRNKSIAGKYCAKIKKCDDDALMTSTPPPLQKEKCRDKIWRNFNAQLRADCPFSPLISPHKKRSKLDTMNFRKHRASAISQAENSRANKKQKNDSKIAQSRPADSVSSDPKRRNLRPRTSKQFCDALTQTDENDLDVSSGGKRRFDDKIGWLNYFGNLTADEQHQFLVESKTYAKLPAKKSPVSSTAAVVNSSKQSSKKLKPARKLLAYKTPVVAAQHQTPVTNSKAASAVARKMQTPQRKHTRRKSEAAVVTTPSSGSGSNVTKLKIIRSADKYYIANPAEKPLQRRTDAMIGGKLTSSSRDNVAASSVATAQHHGESHNSKANSKTAAGSEAELKQVTWKGDFAKAAREAQEWYEEAQSVKQLMSSANSSSSISNHHHFLCDRQPDPASPDTMRSDQYLDSKLASASENKQQQPQLVMNPLSNYRVQLLLCRSPKSLQEDSSSPGQLVFHYFKFHTLMLHTYSLT